MRTPQPVRRSDTAADYAVEHYAGVIAYGSDNPVAVAYPSNAEVGDDMVDLPLLVREEPSR